MNFKKFASAFLIAGFASSLFAAEGEFALKGNVQTEVTKSIGNDSTNIDKGWIRANIGGQYKSENLDATIMLRIFAPEFGNKIDGANYDKILADLYWVNYKWHPSANDQINLKIGRWKTDWSQSTHFGTYIDKDLTKHGLWQRDYSHNALEVGWQHGINQLNFMLGIKNGTADQGYIRIEDDLKLESIPLEFKAAYRVNAIDVVQNTANLTHRLAAYASYTIIPELRAYGEYAWIYTNDETHNPDGHNYINPESKYFEPGIYYQPFYLGLDFAPKSGIMSKLMTNFMMEWEYINKRDNLYKVSKHTYDDWAWTLAWNKKIGFSKLQLSMYSGNEMSDVAFAFRLTTTIK